MAVFDDDNEMDLNRIARPEAPVAGVICEAEQASAATGGLDDRLALHLGLAPFGVPIAVAG